MALRTFDRIFTGTYTIGDCEKGLCDGSGYVTATKGKSENAYIFKCVCSCADKLLDKTTEVIVPYSGFIIQNKWSDLAAEVLTDKDILRIKAKAEKYINF